MLNIKAPKKIKTWVLAKNNKIVYNYIEWYLTIKKGLINIIDQTPMVINLGGILPRKKRLGWWLNQTEILQ